MKEPSSLFRHRKKPTSTKLKLICSFNGAFHVRPPSDKLRYIGGESRIISVDRNISFSKLRSKISDICPNIRSFSLKYQLPVSNSDEETPLVLIASDEDVRCMVEEYEKMELYGKHTRLWVFVCSSECGDAFVKGNSTVGCYVNCVDGCHNSLCANNGDHSLRKIALNHQLLAKNSAEIKTIGENKKYEHPLIDLDLGTEPEISMIQNDPFQVNNMLVFNGMENSHSHPLNRRDGNLPVERNGSVKPLMGMFGQVFCKEGGTNTVTSGHSSQFPTCNPFDEKRDFRNTRQMPTSNFNRENVMPWAVNYDLINAHLAPLSCGTRQDGSAYPVKSCYVGNRVWDASQNGIRSRRFGVNDNRNQRVHPYYLRNQRNNSFEVGNHKGVRLDGKIPVGKCYPGIRPNSNISKQGQSTRSYNPHSLKLWHDNGAHPMEGRVSLIDSCLNKVGSSFDVQQNKGISRDQGGNAILQCGKSNLEENHLAYHGVADLSFLSCNAIKNPSACTRVIDTQEDLLTGSNSEKLEVPYHTLYENFHGIPSNYESISRDPSNENFQVDSLEDANVSGLSNNMGYTNGAAFGCNMENVTKNLQGGIASSLDLLYNLSLSSSKEVEPPPICSLASSVVSDTLLKPQSNPSDLMDKGEFITGLPVDKSNRVTSPSSSLNVAKSGRVNVHEQEIQQYPPPGLTPEEKADGRNSYKCSNVTSGIPKDLPAYCTRLATQELQTIKNSDLEYIKELGTGTFGTVFYGKWKGSDVAIKRMKPSCFNEGSFEEDRLVADFWREAQMLGQLHHPNIVALYGVVTDGPVTNLATVTEYMVNGSLKQVMRRKDRTIDRRKRLIIAMDAAFGMEYLHGKKIVHFDLKSHNFLVNMRDPQRPVCKIGDLGLSKIKQRTLISGGVRGTIPWMAPELLNSKNKVTEKIDVYSFGIVMWELLTGEEPYGNLPSEEIIAGILKGTLRPEIPSWCDPTWRSLMERCWSTDPESRPAFSEIAKELRAMAASMNIK